MGCTPERPVRQNYAERRGSYSYILNNDNDAVKKLTDGETLTEEFTYTYTDEDGDIATGSVTITIKGNADHPVVKASSIVVDEGDLSCGSHPHDDHEASGSSSFTVDLHGEDGTITLTTVDDQQIVLSVVNHTAFDMSAPLPTLKVNGVEVQITGVTQKENDEWQVSYEYKLTGNLKHQSSGLTGKDDKLSGNISITVTDATGDMERGSLTVEVYDDGPSVHADNVVTFEKGESGASETFDPDGLFSIQAGADGEAVRAYALHLKDGKTTLPSDVKVLLSGYDEPFDVALVQKGNVIVGQITVNGKEQEAFTITLEETEDHSFKLEYKPESGGFQFFLRENVSDSAQLF